jgi:hypothetical protein
MLTYADVCLGKDARIVEALQGRASKETEARVIVRSAAEQALRGLNLS